MKLLLTCFCAVALSAAAFQPDLPDKATGSSPSNASYRLGPGDVLTVDSVQADEFQGKVFRIDTDGSVTFPFTGRMSASGLSVQQLQQELTNGLEKFIREPTVSVTVKEFRSQPVSILGAVNSPGVHQLEGPKTLSEVLAVAGGLREDAGYTVTVTRQAQQGAIPLAEAHPDPSNKFSIARLDLKDILQAKNPLHNIRILPNDVVTVPKAERVYVIGDVIRAGGFTLNEHRGMSVLQALSLSEGLGKTAAPQKARILRPADSDTGRAELPIDIKKILSGKLSDQMLYANDILFVPSSTAKKVTTRAIDAAITTASGVVIWTTAGR